LSLVTGVDFLKNRGYEVESSLVDVPDQPSFKSIQAIAKFFNVID
jgi:F-type H+-transporting ATPase subunit gamma